MSDTEKEVCRQIAIDLINEYRQQRCLKPTDFFPIHTPENSAFIRSIQLHEKTKKELADCKQELSDYKQKVSDVASVCAQHFCKNSWTVGDRQDHVDMLSRLIVPAPKPDPLINVAKMLGYYNTAAKHLAGDIRAALDAAGFEIREKG